MNFLHLIGDLQAGLLSLTLQQVTFYSFIQLPGFLIRHPSVFVAGAQITTVLPINPAQLPLVLLYLACFCIIFSPLTNVSWLSSGKWRTVVDWKTVNPDGLILAVGDVFPLALAWLAYKHHKGRSHQLVDSPEQSPGYAFIGTAKSEFYLRNEDGELLRQSRKLLAHFIDVDGN